LRGVIRLGFAVCDFAQVNLAEAEEAFLAAARYAKSDYPQEAGRSFLSAGWAAYCQGKMTEALAHTEQSMKVYPGLPEALFQASKVLMAQGRADQALPLLAKAIDGDRFYALKAAGDGDFQKNEKAFRDFLEAMRKEKFAQVSAKARMMIEKIDGFKAGRDLGELKTKLERFIAQGAVWPLMDILEMAVVGEKAASSVKGILIKRLSGQTVPCQVTTYETETYIEKVCVREAGFFRKAEYREEKRTRQKPVTKTASKSIAGEAIEFGSLAGQAEWRLEFVPIPAGTFAMGEGKENHKVTLTQDFLLGRHPVTQAQWATVMGDNPSHFKGADHPVEQVYWEDAQKFIAKLNDMAGEKRYRLPSEAEWEYACRADSQSKYCFGDDENRLGDYAWYEANSGKTTHPVGQKKPNTRRRPVPRKELWGRSTQKRGKAGSGPRVVGEGLAAYFYSDGHCIWNSKERIESSDRMSDDLISDAARS
jgi:hypothetical protein